MPAGTVRSRMPTLTVRLPPRPGGFGVLTPEQLQGREPAARGAHGSPDHEAPQEDPGTFEAGSKSLGSHLA